MRPNFDATIDENYINEYLKKFEKELDIEMTGDYDDHDHD